ncbi:hypothetical protein COLO4_02326 [Corchorus olitorius]|uniref:Reverse transcriptase n=1 Tax=Corchorus olitorius TaxID=93759 RepID=A0A1R3L166_9ROSI|nr:hypothetical protein COLO4_02326 [Corchorus olitorius]
MSANRLLLLSCPGLKSVYRNLLSSPKASSGVPLVHGKVRGAKYHELVSKVSTRLSGWKSKALDLSGRARLVSSLTSSILTYTMLTSKLPASFRNSIDKINRRFGVQKQKRGIPLVSWREVCTRLGLRRMELDNRALIQKRAWRFINEPKSLWVRCLTAKYQVQGDFIDYVLNGQSKKILGRPVA